MTLPTKVHLVKAMVFLVVTYGCETKELMRLNYNVGEDCWDFLGLKGDPTSQSSRKSVLNIHWKDWYWSWNSNTLAIWCEELTHWKRPWCWERLKTGGEGDNRGWDGWMTSLTRWTWVWASSRSWWWTGKPGALQSMGSQRIRHNWVTELNWRYAKAIPRDMTVNLIKFYCNFYCCSDVDWFDLLAVQGPLQSLLQHHSSKASVLQCSDFLMVYCNTLVKINIFRDFPGDSAAGTQCFHCRGHGFNLWLVN